MGWLSKIVTFVVFTSTRHAAASAVGWAAEKTLDFIVRCFRKGKR